MVSVTSSSGHQARGATGQYRAGTAGQAAGLREPSTGNPHPGPPGPARLGRGERSRAGACPGGWRGPGDLGWRQGMGVAQLWLGQMTELNPNQRRASETAQPGDSGDGFLEPAKLMRPQSREEARRERGAPPTPRLQLSLVSLGVTPGWESRNPRSGSWPQFVWMDWRVPRAHEPVLGSHAGASPTGLRSPRPQIEAADAALGGRSSHSTVPLPPHTPRCFCTICRPLVCSAFRAWGWHSVAGTRCLTQGGWGDCVGFSGRQDRWHRGSP